MRSLKVFTVFAAVLLGAISTAYGQEGGHVSANLMSLFTGVNSVFSGVCLVIGVGLIFASFIQYRHHRMNKLLVPISKPIFMFILGVVLVGVPILGHYTEGGQLVSQGIV